MKVVAIDYCSCHNLLILIYHHRLPLFQDRLLYCIRTSLFYYLHNIICMTGGRGRFGFLSLPPVSYTFMLYSIVIYCSIYLHRFEIMVFVLTVPGMNKIKGTTSYVFVKTCCAKRQVLLSLSYVLDGVPFAMFDEETPTSSPSSSPSSSPTVGPKINKHQ